MTTANNLTGLGAVNKAMTINKAWAAAIAAPLADWLVGLAAEALWNGPGLAVTAEARLALVSLIVGLVVYWVPNLPAQQGEG
ncbi:hypothetical protein A8950_2340 [Dongia mobilis]|uniref:Holin n=1 Tax=Dongia mobilis TaxID=578943 RepID=A0A4R6WSC4_9PROT|nr:hypothetical protein [Dongia mobilis]TDQ82517.1 hypothetical protein A8950_2340 [Dongia mobilis]